jgi:hypothetical protein
LVFRQPEKPDDGESSGSGRIRDRLCMPAVTQNNELAWRWDH